MVLNSKTQRTHGRQAQLGNIAAARAVADIIRSTLGPRSMLKVRESCFFFNLDDDNIILCRCGCAIIDTYFEDNFACIILKNVL